LVTQALHDRPQRLQRLLELTQQLSATLDLPELLQSIVDAAAELTDSEQASIAEIDSTGKQLRFIAARWMDPKIMADMRVPLEGSITGQAFRKEKPVAVHDTQTSKFFYRQVDEASGFQTRSMLSVPMSMRGETTGVLSALNKTGGEKYSGVDVAVLETLASQAAIAIHNSKLLRETREAYAHLAQLDEMKNNFISITSHELRVPLGLVLGHASVLKETAKGEVLEQVEVIERSALRLKDIVEDLSQIETLQNYPRSLMPQRFDVIGLLDRMVKAAIPAAEEKQLDLVSRLPKGTLEIDGEQEKLHIAIDHILRNALTFTNPGGRVEVSLEDEGDWVRIAVADTGVGIPEADLERIFERFYQVEAHMTRKHGGMGLGLAVAKMMVELHGGEILVESVEGQGSQFTVRLPKRQKAG
jgi:signal transduction histidine kinase